MAHAGKGWGLNWLRKKAAGGRPGSEPGQSLKGLQCYNREPRISPESREELTGLVSRVVCPEPTFYFKRQGRRRFAIGALWEAALDEVILCFACVWGSHVYIFTEFSYFLSWIWFILVQLLDQWNESRRVEKSFFLLYIVYGWLLILSSESCGQKKGAGLVLWKKPQRELWTKILICEDHGGCSHNRHITSLVKVLPLPFFVCI